MMRQMTVEDYKSKEIGLVCDLILSMKQICTGCGSYFTTQVCGEFQRLKKDENAIALI